MFLMAKRVEALVKPELLVWARTSVGLSTDQAAKKVQVKTSRLLAWESGELRPTIRQLRKLGNAYKRPIAVFYLSQPPTAFQPMHDFRRLPGEIAGVQSYHLRLEIRRAHERRRIAIGLYEELEGEWPEFRARSTISEDPEKLAGRIRKLLKIDLSAQTALSSDYEAFNFWRDALENAGILVFQALNVELSEMRGFSISEFPFSAIVVNSKDAPRGRIFTMLHELTHIILRKGGLCDLQEEAVRPNTEQAIEVFCNHVSGATIVPANSLLQQEVVRSKTKPAKWSSDELTQLARMYQASKEVILRRLLINGKTTPKFYEKMRNQFEQEYRRYRGSPKPGFAPPYRKAISTAGPLFVRLVLNNYYQENITSRDISDFLNVRLKHMGKIENEIMGRSIMFGATG